MLDHKFGLAFCVNRSFFIESVIQKVVILCILTFLVIGFLVFFFVQNLNSKAKLNATQEDEILLIKYIIENLPIGIIVFDGSMKIVTINQVAREMLQLKEGEEKTGNSLTQKFLQLSYPYTNCSRTK